MPLLSKASKDFLTSGPDFVENRVNQIYPVFRSNIDVARTLSKGMSSLIIVTSKGSVPNRPIVKLTLVPFFPLSFL